MVVTNRRIEEIESVMAGLGFSSNESRAYIALIGGSPLTGYEIAGKSGIPRSKVYDSVERLERKGLIVPVGDNPVRYAPVPPEELVRRLSAGFAASLERLERLFAEEPPAVEAEYVFNIGGYESILEKARDMIRTARTSLDLAVWGAELESLRGDLERAAGRGFAPRLLVFGRGNVKGCEVYRHPALAPGAFSGRWIAVVRDSGEVLTGRCTGRGDVVAAWTKNKSLVFVSLRYIEHEIIRIRERSGR